MAQDESAGQKTEKPSRRKRERAREEGQVARSVELENAAVLLAATGALALFGGYTFQVMKATMAMHLGHLGAPEISVTGVSSMLSDAIRVVMKAAGPIMIFTGLAGLACSLAQTGFIFAPKKLRPNLGAVNPVKGLKNLISMQAIVKLLVAVLKIAAITVVAFLLIRSRQDWFFALIGKSTAGIMYVCQKLCMTLILRVVLIMIGVAVLDYAYQRWRFEKQLMMSKAEVRDEHKREEGDPQVRARQAQVRKALARARMMQAVPNASIVVTNPTHVAVALQWDEKAMSAPKVVAKGQDYLAERIKQVAREHNVPVVERKVLAWAIYEAVEVGREIPSKLYYAVAEVLAFVLNRKRRAG